MQPDIARSINLAAINEQQCAQLLVYDYNGAKLISIRGTKDSAR